MTVSTGPEFRRIRTARNFRSQGLFMIFWGEWGHSTRHKTRSLGLRQHPYLSEIVKINPR